MDEKEEKETAVTVAKWTEEERGKRRKVNPGEKYANVSKYEQKRAEAEAEVFVKKMLKNFKSLKDAEKSVWYRIKQRKNIKIMIWKKDNGKEKR